MYQRFRRDPPPSPITLLGGPFREMAVDTLTDGVPDREVQFLRTGNSLGGNYEGEIHFLP